MYHIVSSVDFCHSGSRLICCRYKPYMDKRRPVRDFVVDCVEDAQ